MLETARNAELRGNIKRMWGENRLSSGKRGQHEPWGTGKP